MAPSADTQAVRQLTVPVLAGLDLCKVATASPDLLSIMALCVPAADGTMTHFDLLCRPAVRAAGHPIGPSFDLATFQSEGTVFGREPSSSFTFILDTRAQFHLSSRWHRFAFPLRNALRGCGNSSSPASTARSFWARTSPSASFAYASALRGCGIALAECPVADACSLRVLISKTLGCWN